MSKSFSNKPPRVVALIQARMGSTRLPGKVLAPLLDSKPMLQWQLERLSHSKTIDLVIVATSNESGDTPIAAFCESIGVKCFRGSEDNVLERFYKTACAELSPQEREHATLLRLTGDCPLLDTAAIDEGVVEFQKLRPSGCRYYGYDTDLPDGMDFEVFSFEALEDAFKNAGDAFEKEHVTPYMWRRPEAFGLKRFTKAGIPKGLRFSVDYPEDRTLIEALLREELNRGTPLGMKAVADLLISNPELRALNAKIIKNEGLLITSLKSEPHQATIAGLTHTVPNIGVAVPASFKMATDIPDDLIVWADKIGIRVWLTKRSFESALRERLPRGHVVVTLDTQPSGWVAVDGTMEEKNKYQYRERLFTLARAQPKTTGYFLGVTTRGELAEMLMFLLHDRFSYRSIDS